MNSFKHYLHHSVMAKRTAETSEGEGHILKDGARPIANDNEKGGSDFEDEFEDEFESEDEIFEAGEDGRPDEEREAEESRGMWTTLEIFVRTCCPEY